MTFAVTLSTQARRFLETAPDIARRRIAQRIDTLEQEPMQHDTKRVYGQPDKIFRVRVGHYRMLYTVSVATREVAVIRIDKRSRAYD